jgi:hypothetical protein
MLGKAIVRVRISIPMDLPRSARAMFWLPWTGDRAHDAVACASVEEDMAYRLLRNEQIERA